MQSCFPASRHHIAPADICGSGACAGTAVGPTYCDDGNPCTTDQCDILLGCAHLNNTASLIRFIRPTSVIRPTRVTETRTLPPSRCSHRRRTHTSRRPRTCPPRPKR